MLDKSERFESKEGLARVLIEEKAESMSAELGLDAGVQARGRLRTVALDVEMLRELAIKGLNGLTDMGDEAEERGGQRGPAGARAKSRMRPECVASR